MRFYFHPVADDEFDKAVQYYQEYQPGLGLRFAGEVYSAINRIIKFLNSFSRLSKNTRRCMLNRFPYGVIYQMQHNTIHIIAVGHLNRRPGYWRNRVWLYCGQRQLLFNMTTIIT
ncbi:MAG: type II toxin-antitoxin system RelE/ParE family toxin [Kiritimatiellia bacterium]